KTAVKLLKKYETLDNVYAHLDEISGKKLKENLTNYKDDAYLSQELATINLGTPTPIQLDEVTYPGFESSSVYSIFKNLEFNSLLDRVDDGDTEINNTTSEKFQNIYFKLVDNITNEILQG